jgi:serine protease Do
LARRQDPEIAKLLDQFVCVRVIQMWGIDLARFQFDWDLTFAALFLNADGAVYGRFGTRKNRDHAERDTTTAGFKKSAEGALVLHAAYPGNAKELEGKKARAARWPTVDAIPALKGRPNIKAATGERAGCVHCHQVHEGELWSLRAGELPLPDRILWTFPAAEDAGLELDPAEMAKIAGSTSLAAAAGFKAGDRILHLGGQPIISTADVQWVLHHAEDGETLRAEVDRHGERLALRMKLTEGWRRRGDYTWRSISWSLRHRLAGTGMLESQPARPGEMALRIKALPPDWVKDRNRSAAAELRAGDTIIAVDGRKDLAREADFMAYLLQKKAAGAVVILTVLRGGKTVQASVKLP